MSRPVAAIGCCVLALVVLSGATTARASSGPQETAPTTLVARVADEGGAAVSEHDVVVLIIDAERQVADELMAKTSETGEARFENVSVGPGFSAWASTTYETASYQGDPVSLTPGVEAIIPLTVYSVSDAPTNLHIEMLHVIINTIEPGLYQVVQVMSVLNPGEQAGFSGEQYEGRPIGLAIPVPDGATGVGPIPQFSGLDAANMATEENRILDLRPVPPGSHQIAVQYDLMTDSGGSDLAITMPYPTAEVSMLVGPGLGITQIESAQLTELEPVAIPNQGDFANYRSDVLGAGEVLNFHLGPPEAPLSIGSWALVALAAALFAGAVVSMLSGRKGPPAETSAPPAPHRGQLIAEVAQLDDQHAAGSLADADYEARRADVIARIVAIDEGAAGGQGRRGA